MVILAFLFGLTLGILITIVYIAKFVGWIDLIVEDEKHICTKPEETES